MNTTYGKSSGLTFGDGRSSPPRVSVIVVTYNSSEFLARCLDSLLLSTDSNMISDILVVDNGSSDGTADIGASYSGRDSRVKLILLGKNYGLTKAFNIGAEKSEGNVLVIANPDTQMGSGCLSELSRYLSMDNVAVVQPKLLRGDGKQVESEGGRMDILGHGYHILHHENASSSHKPDYIFYACFAFAMIRKEAFLKLGGLDPDFFLYSDDVDFCWRSWLAGYKVLYVPKATVQHTGQHAARKVRHLALFHSRKNRLTMLYANYPYVLATLTTVTLSVTYVLGGVVAYLRGDSSDSKAFLEATTWFWANFRLASSKRKSVMLRRVIPPRFLLRREMITLNPMGLRLHLADQVP
jgi:GT2 family glycosyltransferase